MWAANAATTRYSRCSIFTTLEFSVPSSYRDALSDTMKPEVIYVINRVSRMYITMTVTRISYFQVTCTILELAHENGKKKKE